MTAVDDALDRLGREFDDASARRGLVDTVRDELQRLNAELDCAITGRDQWKAANTEAYDELQRLREELARIATVPCLERVRQLEDGLREFLSSETPPTYAELRALLAADSPPETK